MCKEIHSRATMLCYPDPTPTLVLHANAADTAIDAALHQKTDQCLYPLAFFLKNFLLLSKASQLMIESYYLFTKQLSISDTLLKQSQLLHSLITNLFVLISYRNLISALLDNFVILILLLSFRQVYSMKYNSIADALSA